MPPIPVWVAGMALGPTSVYSLYHFIYLPRIGAQSEAERLSDAITRPRQLLESDLLAIGGDGAKGGLWSAPNGQRDVPFKTDLRPHSDIPNGDRFDCELPPYHQPSGALPQTNAEKIALFSLLQYLRVAIISGCPPGNAENPMCGIVQGGGIAAASTAAHLAPQSQSSFRGTLVNPNEPNGPATSSKAALSPTPFARLTDQHREELLRRIAHTEIEKLCQLGIEGDTRYISATRVARHAGLPAEFDTVVVSTSIENEGHSFIGPATKTRYLRSREDGLFVAKPLHYWVRKRIDACAANKSGSVTSIVESDGSYEAEFSSTPANTRNKQMPLPNGSVSATQFIRDFGSENDSVVSALRRQGFSRMLAAPYLRFRSAELSDKEKMKSRAAYIAYLLFFKNPQTNKAQHPGGLRAASPPSFISRTLGIQSKQHIQWLGMGSNSSDAHPSMFLIPCAVFIAKVCFQVATLAGIFKSKYSAEWEEEMRYRLADALVHRVLEIETRMSIVADNGALNTITVNGNMTIAEGLERDLSRNGDRLLLVISPSTWLEELGLYASAKGLCENSKVQSLSILALPSVPFPDVFNALLHTKRDQNPQAESKFRCGVWNRTDLFPLGVAKGQFNGLPRSPSPIGSVANLSAEKSGSASGDVVDYLESLELVYRPVASTGAAQFVVLNPTPADPMLYSFPDKRIVSSGIDSQNAIEQLQNRGHGNDDNVFISDEKVRQKHERTSAVSKVGGMVGKGNTLSESFAPATSAPQPSKASIGKNVENNIWLNERMAPTGLQVINEEFPVSYRKFRESNCNGCTYDPTLFPSKSEGELAFGGRKKILEFTIGRPAQALPTIAQTSNRIALQFFSLDHLRSLLAAQFLASNAQSEEPISSQVFTLLERQAL